MELTLELFKVLLLYFKKTYKPNLRHRAGGLIREVVGSNGSLRDLDWALFLLRDGIKLFLFVRVS